MSQGHVSSSVAKLLEDAFYTQKILSNFVLYGFKSPYPDEVKRFILSIFNKTRLIISCRKPLHFLCTIMLKLKIILIFMFRWLLS